MIRTLPVPRFPAERIILQEDFSGGVDLRRLGYGRASKTVAYALNVDWIREGGFEARKTATTFSPTTIEANVNHLFVYETDALRRMVLCLDNGKVFTLAAENGVPAALIDTTGPKRRAFQCNDRMFLLDGENACRAWDGTTLSTLGVAWNASPVGSPTYDNANMPVAKYGVVFGGRAHVAHTKEGGTVYRDRIRQSMPLIGNTGERDWREKDYIDVAGDGQWILGLATAGRRMFILRQRSIYELTGSDATQYAVFSVTQDEGVSGENAFTTYKDVLWAWSSETGLHYTLGFRPSDAADHDNVMQAMMPIMTELIDHDTVTIACLDDRVLCNVVHKRMGRITLVYDIQLKAWTIYDLGFGASAVWIPAGKTAITVAEMRRQQSPKKLIKLGQDAASDNFGAGPIHVSTRLITGWMDDERPTERKRFHCLSVVAETDSPSPFAINIRTDWETNSAPTTATIPGVTVTPPSGGSITELTGVPPLDSRKQDVRLQTCGRSVQAEIVGPIPSGRWRVRSIIFHYRPDARYC